MQIEGIPDGWELVRFDYATDGERYLDGSGDIVHHLGAKPTQAKRLIIRKIEKYRPFANTAEAEVMWDAKLQLKEHSDDKFRVTAIRVTGVVIGASWYNYEEAFERFECVDGTPFGVEVTE